VHGPRQKIGAILIVLLQLEIGLQEMLQHLVAFEPQWLLASAEAWACCLWWRGF
jgi:hypothetical protein